MAPSSLLFKLSLLILSLGTGEGDRDDDIHDFFAKSANEDDLNEDARSRLDSDFRRSCVCGCCSPLVIISSIFLLFGSNKPLSFGSGPSATEADLLVSQDLGLSTIDRERRLVALALGAAMTGSGGTGGIERSGFADGAIDVAALEETSRVGNVVSIARLVSMPGPKSIGGTLPAMGLPVVSPAGRPLLERSIGEVKPNGGDDEDEGEDAW